MKKKLHKVEETAAAYTDKRPAQAETPKPVKPDLRDEGDAAFKKVADKIFFERKELLHKLAQ